MTFTVSIHCIVIFICSSGIWRAKNGSIPLFLSQLHLDYKCVHLAGTHSHRHTELRATSYKLQSAIQRHMYNVQCTAYTAPHTHEPTAPYTIANLLARSLGRSLTHSTIHNRVYIRRRAQHNSFFSSLSSSSSFHFSLVALFHFVDTFTIVVCLCVFIHHIRMWIGRYNSTYMSKLLHAAAHIIIFDSLVCVCIFVSFRVFGLFVSFGPSAPCVRFHVGSFCRMCRTAAEAPPRSVCSIVQFFFPFD